jgi:hypothetical protein
MVLVPSTANDNMAQSPVDSKASGHGEEARKNAIKIHDVLCNSKFSSGYKEKDWHNLCSSNFVMMTAQLLLDMHDINVVQIGAHVGFESNDPLAKGLSRLLDEAVAHAESNTDPDNDLRKRFHWTFVEPSPPNFKRLTENLSKKSGMCDMKGINAAVVSDSIINPGKMPFYTIRDTIDPTTGFDSLSGKKLPHWVTQVSSFSEGPIRYTTEEFEKKGLDVNDYIVKIDVVTKSYSDLMKEALHIVGDKKGEKPLLVLIDTEGFDCEIIKGISPSSPFLPKFILFEHKSCKDVEEAYKHLRDMGYSLALSGENTLAVTASM